MIRFRLTHPLLISILILSFSFSSCAWFNKSVRDERKQKEVEQMSEEFKWWPSDAQPAPVKDEQKGGYWWWPSNPGEIKPWGNRGYIYLYKIIYDYKAEELPAPQPKELRPSLLIRKIMKNVKIYFDYNKAELRPDHTPILENAINLLNKNPEASILITGNCDARGSDEYNMKLGNKRGQAVKDFMLQQGIPEARIKIVSRGKLDAVSPINNLLGMQKDRNAQFMVAQVEEVMLPYEGPPQDVQAQQVEEGKYIVEEQQRVESEVKVSTKEYVTVKGDSLWNIAKREWGNGYRWKYLYELNKDRIKDPNKLKPGITILIPVE